MSSGVSQAAEEAPRAAKRAADSGDGPSQVGLVVVWLYFITESLKQPVQRHPCTVWMQSMLTPVSYVVDVCCPH